MTSQTVKASAMLSLQEAEPIYYTFWYKIHHNPLPNRGPVSAYDYPSGEIPDRSYEGMLKKLHLDLIESLDFDKFEERYPLIEWEDRNLQKLELPDGAPSGDREQFGRWFENYRDDMKAYAQDIKAHLGEMPALASDGTVKDSEVRRFSPKIKCCQHDKNKVKPGDIGRFRLTASLKAITADTTNNVHYCDICDDYYDLGKPSDADMNTVSVESV